MSSIKFSLTKGIRSKTGAVLNSFLCLYHPSCYCYSWFEIHDQKWPVNTMRARQNGRRFADDVFKCIFLNENDWIPIKISLKFVLEGPINNIPALVQIMACRRPGDKPLSEPMMASLPTHICVTRPQWVKAPFTQGCDLRATLERPENWPGRSAVAKTQKVQFPCNCCSTAPVRYLNHQNCCRSCKGGRVGAELSPWWLKWSPNGGTVVATVIAQSTLLGGQRKHNGGTREAEASLNLIHNAYNSTHFTGRPMADLCASILRPHPASFERPVSDRLPRRHLCDCFEHAPNFTAAMAPMARSERPLCHPWTTKATFRPPLCLQRRPGQFCGRTREAQRSQLLG